MFAFLRLISWWFLLSFPLLAATPNSLFSDNLVLQENKPIPVWGIGTAGEKVTVTLKDQTATGTVSAEGTWKVTLPALPAGGPYELTISGTPVTTLHQVLIGEVWLCSGQSNMERQLGLRPPQVPIDNWEQEAATADFPQIRQFYVPEVRTGLPTTDVHGAWTVCTPQTAPQFSAVSFFFGRALYQKIHKPIGLVFSSVGGTPVQAWTSPEALEAAGLGKVLAANLDKAKAAYQTKLAAYQTQLPKLQLDYQTALTAAQATNAPPALLPKPPQPPRDPAKAGAPGYLYQAMIAPLIPFPIAGVIWYQGESNSGDGLPYQSLFSCLSRIGGSAGGKAIFPSSTSRSPRSAPMAPPCGKRSS